MNLSLLDTLADLASKESNNNSNNNNNNNNNNKSNDDNSTKIDLNNIGEEGKSTFNTNTNTNSSTGTGSQNIGYQHTKVCI